MEGICRGCLLKSYELLQYTEKNRRLYVYCTGLQVKRNDAFTFQLCKGCYVNMKLACKFKKQCRASDKRFKHFTHLKENGEVTDFASYLRNDNEPALLRFPCLNGISYEPPVQRPRDDDFVSTTTSIRNFVKELIQPDEIPDTEARIIQQVIEEEADVLDETLDSVWLQDDVSIDTDFRFSFSPLSSPQRRNNNDYTPEQEMIQNFPHAKDDDYSKNLSTDGKRLKKKSAFKKNLLKTKSHNKANNSVNKKIPVLDKYSMSAHIEDLDNDSVIETNTNPQASEDMPMNMDDEDFIASKIILLNRRNNYRKNKSPPPIDIDIKVEHVMEDISQNENLLALLQNEESNQQKSIMGKTINEEKSSEKRVQLLQIMSENFNQSKTLQHLENNENNLLHKSSELQALLANKTDLVNNDNLTAAEKDSIDRNLEKALQSSENQEFPLNALIAIATPSVNPGISGASTPLINDILFGEKLDTQSKKSSSSISVDSSILDEFLIQKGREKHVGQHQASVSTDEYCESECDKLEANDSNEPNPHVLIKPGKCQYDLSDMSCKLCDKKFNTPKGLRIHFIKRHNYKIDRFPHRLGEKFMEVTCEICGKVFNRLSYLKKHLKTGAHQNDVKTCKYCFLDFTSDARLTVHMRTHKNVTVEKKSPKYKRKYQIHVCHVCGFESTSASALQVHVRRHNKDYDHECPECGVTFYRKSDFLVHTRTHSGQRPYSCLHCPKRFSRSDTLNRHMKIHTNERIYMCSFCGAKFIDKASLNQHIARAGKSCRSKSNALKAGLEDKENKTTKESGEIIETYSMMMEFEELASNDTEDSNSILHNYDKTDNNEEQRATDGEESQTGIDNLTPLVNSDVGLHLLLGDVSGSNGVPLYPEV